jgi:hypothetical protein
MQLVRTATDRVATATTADPSSGGAFEGVVHRIGWHSTVLESVADGREGCVSLCMTPIGQPCGVNQ